LHIRFHCYGDDTRLYISSHSDETYQFTKLMEYIVDLKNWMASYFPQLNTEKRFYLLDQKP